MKTFFASFFGTIVGLIVTFFLIVIIVVALVASAIGSASSDKPYKIKEKSLLHIQLNHEIAERSSKNPLENFDFGSMSSNKPLGLKDIVENIHNAETDENIKGIYLDLSGLKTGYATVEEIRNSLLHFKNSGKFIVSYGEEYSQGAYYLASVADKIYLNPQGAMEWKGLSAQVLFFKGALEKLDIEPQIFRHGKFKSAIEPFMLDKMSDANREQTKTYVFSFWNHMVAEIAKARKVSEQDLNTWATNLSIQSPEDAKKLKLVDELFYKDEFTAELKKRLSVEEKDKVNLVSISQYSRVPQKEKKGKNKVAIVYAVGSIESGEGDDETIGSERISEAIRQARKDSTVKAIVLRVNSPGGSALASDVIWREVVLAKKVKPVVVSMGNLAASGGYYISCAADVIVAQPNTITGSIGVFGLMLNTQKLMREKLGITFDTVNTNKHADMGTALRGVTDEEGKVITKEVERVYNTFISRVADGRHLTLAQVDSIGQGRVWSGADALKIGLVDELGGLDKAIEIAAKKAKLEEYKLLDLPKQKDPFQELLKDFSEDVRTSSLKSELGENYKYYQHLRELANAKDIQAKLFYEIEIK